MRHYLTTWIWYQDRLDSLPSSYLAGFTVLCLTGLGTLAWAMLQFLDDLAFLISDNDPRIVLVLVQILLTSSAALWVLSCCLGALARRFVLRRRGL